MEFKAFPFIVRADHAAKGEPGRKCKCPVALALLEQIPGVVHVAVGTLFVDLFFEARDYFDDEPHVIMTRSISVILDENTRKFIEHFDRMASPALSYIPLTGLVDIPLWFWEKVIVHPDDKRGPLENAPCQATLP